MFAQVTLFLFLLVGLLLKARPAVPAGSAGCSTLSTPVWPPRQERCLVTHRSLTFSPPLLPPQVKMDDLNTDGRAFNGLVSFLAIVTPICPAVVRFGAFLAEDVEDVLEEIEQDEAGGE